MNHIRDSLIRYHQSEGRSCENLENLVPKYLPELQKDKWGNDYTIIPSDGVILSAGPDGKIDLNDYSSQANQDNTTVSFLPPLAILDFALTVDANGNKLIDTGDVITIYFSKKPATPTAASSNDFEFSGHIDNNSIPMVKFHALSKDSAATGIDSQGNPANGDDIGLLTVQPPVAGAVPGELDGRYDFVNLIVSRDPGSSFQADVYICFSPAAISLPWSSAKYADKRRILPLASKNNVRCKRPGEY